MVTKIILTRAPSFNIWEKPGAFGTCIAILKGEWNDGVVSRIQCEAFVLYIQIKTCLNKFKDF